METLNKYKRASDNLRSTLKYICHVWKNFHINVTSLGVESLWVHPDIIVTMHCLIAWQHVNSGWISIDLSMYYYIHVSIYHYSNQYTLHISKPAKASAGEQSEVQYIIEIKCTDRCSWRAWSGNRGDTHLGQRLVTSGMNLEGPMNHVWWWICRLRLSELQGALEGHDQVNIEMHSST